MPATVPCAWHSLYASLLYIVEQEFARNNPFFRNISNNEVSGDSATIIANLKRPQLKLQGNALFWVTSRLYSKGFLKHDRRARKACQTFCILTLERRSNITICF